jgi:hypothetical protein
MEEHVVSPKLRNARKYQVGTIDRMDILGPIERWVARFRMYKLYMVIMRMS